MLLPYYLSRASNLRERFGWLPIGYFEYKLNIGAKYARFLLDRLDSMDHEKIELIRSMVKERIDNRYYENE